MKHRHKIIVIAFLGLLINGITACTAVETTPTVFRITPNSLPSETEIAQQPPSATIAPEDNEIPQPEPQETEVLTEQGAFPINQFPDPPQLSGEIMILYGKVLDLSGSPIPDLVLEIWQTDASGVYDHPGDPGTETRDKSFQFFGSTTTDVEGNFAFRTLKPGQYEPRPPHIHWKVKMGGVELLTSQFYFTEDQVGSPGDPLVIQLESGTDPNGRPVLLAQKDIVINTGTGSLAPTPAQAEGPYYPLVDLDSFDNDLLILD